jgi:activator of HSP90 ATPase
MKRIIKQSVVFPASAETLYNTYLDPLLHGAAIGAPVTVGAESGSPFEAFGGQLKGSTLAVVPARLIVQSWRSANFKDSDPDSTLILSFTPEGKDGRIDLVHIDVPEQDYQGVEQGWDKYYWAPWKTYFARK